MSTPNFAKNNASNFYCVGLDKDGDDFYWDDVADNIRVTARQYGFWKTDETDRDWYRQMNYVTENVFEMGYGGETYHATALIGMRSGYYEGANIDYNIILSDSFGCGMDLEDGDTHKLVEDFIEDKYRYEQFAVNKGLAMMHRKGLEKRLEKWLDSIVGTCEEIAKSCCEDELVFSNGEACYERKK